MCLETQPSAQSSVHNLNVDNSSQNTRKIRYYNFEVLSKYTVSLWFAPVILARILSGNNFFGCNLAHFHSHMNFWILSVTWKEFSNHDVYINQVRFIKGSKLNGFVLSLFCLFGLGQNLTSENFPILLISSFLNKITFLSKNCCFFQKVELSLKE